MKSYWTVLVGVILAWLIGLPAIFFGMNFLMFHQTKIAKEEIVIGRTIGLAGHFEYGENPITGDRVLTVSKMTPFRREYVNIEYNGTCRCIEKVFYNGWKGQYYLRRRTGSTAYYSTGDVVPYRREVPISEVQEILDKAEAQLKKVRSRYTKLWVTR